MLVAKDKAAGKKDTRNDNLKQKLPVLLKVSDFGLSRDVHEENYYKKVRISIK